MENIIVPTDFSPTAGAALRYAYFLAEATGLGVEVLHVHDGHGESSRRNVRRAIDLFIRANLESAQTIAGVGEEEAEVNVSGRAIVGTPTATLIAASHLADTRMIVMGGVGAGVASDLAPLFGSIAREVAERAACPVLLVPKEYGEPVMKRASIAFNWIGALRETSNGFEFLRTALAPSMRLVHVRDLSKTAEVEKEMALLGDIMNTEFPGYPVELDLPEPGVTARRLLSYARNNQIDLLVLSRRNRSLFERLFLRSEVGPVLEHGSTPMLIIPVLHE